MNLLKPATDKDLGRKVRHPPSPQMNSKNPYWLRVLPFLGVSSVKLATCFVRINYFPIINLQPLSHMTVQPRQRTIRPCFLQSGRKSCQSLVMNAISLINPELDPIQIFASFNSARLNENQRKERIIYYCRILSRPSPLIDNQEIDFSGCPTPVGINLTRFRTPERSGV